jgi:CubicO group peptidase (beta-lactamase class C family)
MMSSNGLSKARLERMHRVMAGHVERGALPGMVTAISRRGEILVDAIGAKAFDAGQSAITSPMARDTIFRISSMTKPVAAVAAMILVEECRLQLDDPVDEWLPELANRRVLRQIDGPLDATVPAHRPITLRDLLTLRMGLGHILAESSDYPIQQAINAQQLLQGPPQPQHPPAPDEWIRRVATLPLVYQPGEQWLYELGFDVLGVLIARVAGQPLDRFLHTRIFEPLGMKDTGFSVPATKLDRLATAYSTSADSGAPTVYDDAAQSQWRRPPAFPSAGGGLVSTVDDYLAFGQMMLNKGRLGNERILSRLSVELMTTDQLTPVQKADAAMFFGDNSGWGFGMSVVLKRDDLLANPGRFGWDGGLGTSWASDPNEDLVAILMTQRSMDSPSGPRVVRDFWTSVYQAIND